MTIYLSNRDGNGKTSEEGHYKFQTAVYQGNVLGENDCKVSETTPASLQVSVSVGQFKIDTTGYSYTGWINNAATVSVDTPDAANPRITTIVLYVDKDATTSPSPPNNPGVVKLASIDGTPSATPVAPNDTAIRAEIGIQNPFIRLATINVAALASSITNADITDVRVPITINEDIIKRSPLELRTNEKAYPVGSIYMNASVDTNPATLLGFGTWVAFGSGRALVSVDIGDADFNTTEKTGGAKEHTLTVGEMPTHGMGMTIHGQENGTDIVNQSVVGGTVGGSSIARYGNHPTFSGSTSRQSPSWSWGGSQPHNNLQPYITVYMWKRTA